MSKDNKPKPPPPKPKPRLIPPTPEKRDNFSDKRPKSN